MSEESTEQTTATTEAESATTATPVAPAGDAATESTTESHETDWVAEARKWEKRAKDNAAKLKEADPVKLKAEIASAIAKAMGLAEEPPDPAALTQQLTAQTAAAKDAQIELAVFKAAEDAKGDPAALLDSRSFRDTVRTLDPSDSAAIAAAITDAVTANPRLGRPEPAQPGMKRNPAQGASASSPLGLNEQIAAATAAGNTKLAIRLKSAQALNPN